MKLEEIIKQTRFTNNFEKLSVNLLVTRSWLENFLHLFFKQEDITLQQYNILRILRGSNPTPLSTLQIRERMIDKMSDTSRIVDRLVIKKLVSKKTSIKDNRLVDVKITPKGLQLLTKLDTISEVTAKKFSTLSEEEAITLSDLLDKLRGPDN